MLQKCHCNDGHEYLGQISFTVTGLSILGLIPQLPGRIEQGRIVFEGTDLLTLSDKDMRRIRGNRIAMIFQDPYASLNPRKKISRIVGDIFDIHEMLSIQERQQRVQELLDDN